MLAVPCTFIHLGKASLGTMAPNSKCIGAPFTRCCFSHSNVIFDFRRLHDLARLVNLLVRPVTELLQLTDAAWPSSYYGLFADLVVDMSSHASGVVKVDFAFTTLRSYGYFLLAMMMLLQKVPASH